MTWLILVLIVLKEIGLMDAHFMSFGPSDLTIFMGVTINTWYKWGLVAAFTFINTSVNDFMSDAISPWILNTITDHKTHYIPYTKCVCLTITQFWSIYCNIMSVFSIFLAMSQLDFVLIRMSADMLVNAYTTTKFMRNKTYCPVKYRQFSASHEDAELRELTSKETSVFSVDDGMLEDETSTRKNGGGPEKA
jgi:hypothetical protein